MRRRRIILIVGLPLYALALMVVGTMLLVFIASDDRLSLAPLKEMAGLWDELSWWGSAGGLAAGAVVLQSVFLVPMFTRRPPREQRGRSLTASLMIGAAVAAVLTMALAAALVDLFWMLSIPQGDPADKGSFLWALPIATLLLSWGFWSVLLFLFSRGIWADRVLGRLVGVLLAGTLLELLVVVPIDIMVRRRTDCYCATGTWVSLIAAAAVTLWLAGPGVVIALTSKRHRLWRETHCEGCGYAKGPSPGPQCPECGHAWPAGRSRARGPGG